MRYFVIFSVYPPGEYYQQFRLVENVEFAHTWDWDSLEEGPKWTMSPSLFDAPLNPNACIIFDVRSVAPEFDGAEITSIKLAPFGWGFAPLFDEEYFSSGKYAGTLKENDKHSIF